MKGYGGFEGNAQTLRILAKLEKKATIDRDFVPVKGGVDRRCGLNLSFRTLASVLKYDHEIPIVRSPGDGIVKGYYHTEKEIVDQIKRHVLGEKADKKLKTIECKIMDIADDIAYSTYDMEDAFKAEFLCPLGILSSDKNFLEKLAEKVSRGLRDIEVDSKEVADILTRIYWEIFHDETIIEMIKDLKNEGICDETELAKVAATYLAYDAFDFSHRICSNGYFRTNHTSTLVGKFISGVFVGKMDHDAPALTEICLEPEIRKEVEVLKRYTYNAVIQSPRLKIAEFRGYDIVKEIFETLVNDQRKGYNLLPQDFRDLYDSFENNEALKKRVICDFIAGMTDKYAVDFYARLKSENPQTIFKPF